MTDEKPATPEPDKDPDWTKRGQLLERAWVEVRYHRRRERFFDLLDKGSKAIALCIGTTILGQSFQSLFPIIGSLLIMISLFELIFGFGERRYMHKSLGECAANLAANIEKVPWDEVDSKSSAVWGFEFALIAAKSPPTLKALKLICEREQLVATGKTEWANQNCPALPKWRRFVADLF